jgi:beta-xylosidase
VLADGGTTPIIAGFYPDPTICRLGGDYYLAHSSFEYFPGAPIFRSTDLVTWTQIGNILTRRSQFRRGDGRPSAGIYGSTLRHHDGRFWFITTNVSDYGSGQVLVHAEDPAGEWSDPVFIGAATGIDPDLCWDDDGQCHLTWHALDFTTGEQSIRQARIDLAAGELTEPSYEVWQGSGLAAAEGPHLYHVGDQWYLLLAEGGTERGHCVTMARASRPQGPFESCPHNPVFTHRSTAHPVQNVGHADLVQTLSGEWAAVYLGTRPRGSTPGFHVLGRETFLAGIDWVDGWPVFVEDGFEVPPGDHEFADDFSAPELDHRWVVPGGEPANTASKDESGGLTLHPGLDGRPTLLCFRVRDLRWSAEVALESPGRFLLRVDDRHWYGLMVDEEHVRASAQVGEIHQEIAAVSISLGPARLRIDAVAPTLPTVPLGDAGPDEIVLSVVEDLGVRELARLDGRYLSTEVASGFTGRMLAIGATTSPARLRSVTYRAHADKP